MRLFLKANPNLKSGRIKKVFAGYKGEHWVDDRALQHNPGLAASKWPTENCKGLIFFTERQSGEENLLHRIILTRKKQLELLLVSNKKLSIEEGSM